MTLAKVFGVAICLALTWGHAAAAGVRIKDIASLQGVRENQIVGYGLVIGLKGTGDSLRNSPFTEQSLQSMLDGMGINVRDASLRTRNVAGVIVTAELPPYIGKGARIDITASSLGDATSLLGGTLVMTPLMGADGQIYAVAQGPVAVSGLSSEGDAESLTIGVPTTGRIPNGGMVEREVAGDFDHLDSLVLELKNPDFTTAMRVVDSINAFAAKHYGGKVAEERDFRTIALAKPPNLSAPRFISEITQLSVVPDSPARVVIDERTGTVVIGQDVQISTVAVTHGNLTVRVTEAPEVSQPAPLSDGETTTVPRTLVDASQSGGEFAILGGADLQTLVSGLNQIGLKPTGIIAILQAIKSAGALQAELIVQ
jgi:flagellar P-ring protein precursor FlgI